MSERSTLRQIARRASDLYERLGIHVQPQFILTELTMVHDQVCKLRLDDLLAADDSNFAHDIGGIHRHFNMVTMQLEDCFLPRFADAT